MKNRLFISFFAIIFMLTSITACGPSDTVRLTYPQKQSGELPSPSAPTVAVVLFLDKRPYTHLGMRKDNTKFATSVAVPEWVSRSFADALSRQGFQVSYAESAEVARRAKPQYIVTGILNQAELQEVSIAELRSTIQVDITLAGPQGNLLTEGLSASQSKAGIILESTVEDLLRQTVQELIKPAASKITKIINKK